jgi:hypothetical protein
MLASELSTTGSEFREVLATHPPLDATCPAGHWQGSSMQILRLRSDSTGFRAGEGSLHEPFSQIRRRRSVSPAFDSCAFSSGVSPIRGAEIIFSLPEIF